MKKFTLLIIFSTLWTIIFAQELTIMNDGKVGIGVTNPTSLLHLEGSQATPVTLTVHNLNNNGSERLFFGTSTSSDAYMQVDGSNPSLNSGKWRFLNNRIGAHFDWMIDASQRMVLHNNGNLGVGIGLPTAQVHIQQTGVSDAFRVDDQSMDDSPFVINSDGDVGIGTSSPHADLHVIGSARMGEYGMEIKELREIDFDLDNTGNYTVTLPDGYTPTNIRVLIATVTTPIILTPGSQTREFEYRSSSDYIYYSVYAPLSGPIELKVFYTSGYNDKNVRMILMKI
jgi:hypothetical protein